MHEQILDLALHVDAARGRIHTPRMSPVLFV